MSLTIVLQFELKRMMFISTWNQLKTIYPTTFALSTLCNNNYFNYLIACRKRKSALYCGARNPQS